MPEANVLFNMVWVKFSRTMVCVTPLMLGIVIVPFPPCVGDDKVTLVAPLDNTIWFDPLVTVTADENVFPPASVWAPVVTTPRAVALASGRLKVCVDVADAMLKSVPVVPTANVCVVAVSVFSVEIPPVVGVCQVAAVPEVAVSTWPAVGAVAANTSIAVVADNNCFAAIVFVVLVRVLFVIVCASAKAATVSVVPPKLGNVRVAGDDWVDVRVNVFVVPRTIWFVAALTVTADENVFAPPKV